MDGSAPSELSVDEFVYFSSPRYYRLVFPELKPATKNGDLLAALGELRRHGVVSDDSTWERIRLTAKGKRYKKLISQMLDLGALHAPQTNGLFDYRSEAGRRVVVDLVRFLAAKFNFSEYFRYLSLPVFEPEVEENDATWLAELGEEVRRLKEEAVDGGREALVEFLRRRKATRRLKRTTGQIAKKFYQSTTPLQFDLRVIKRFLREKGLNRPEPLFNHFNLAEPLVFYIHDRQFSILLPQLKRVVDLLSEYLADFDATDASWIEEYFQLVQLPTDFFGFKFSGFDFSSREVDAFLSSALEGPQLFAGQFSELAGLGRLRLIASPLNEEEILLIYCEGQRLLYFTLPATSCTLSTETTANNVPLHLLVSTKPRSFGKLQAVNSSSWGEGAGKRAARKAKAGDGRAQGAGKAEGGAKDGGERKDDRGGEPDQTKLWTHLAFSSASFFSICQIVAQKMTPEFQASHALVLYEGGTVEFAEFRDSNNLLVTVNLARAEIGPEVERVVKKLTESVESLLDGEKLA
ncbi:MAG: hypothetical protein Kow0069_38170 [Promethearchaeota archaeon]